MLRAVQAHAEGVRLQHGEPVPAPDLSIPAKAWIHTDQSVPPAPYVAAAERIAEGWLDVFALRGVDLGSPPRWNRDPRTGIEAPLEHGKCLDYADPDRVGDIKYLWEPNRHRHLVTLAQAYALTAERKYFQVIVEHLDSWFLACPYPLGANWASASEAGMRLINWSAAWQLLGGCASPVFQAEPYREFRARWLRSVYQHLSFVRGWLSLHSADGRLVAEAAALFVGALTWPHWPQSRLWLGAGKALLEREALAQTAADGVNREQALASQQLALETQILCLLAGRAHGQKFSAAYETRIEAMLDFLASIMDASGNVPMFGDADDNSLFSLSSRNNDPYKSLLATGAILFERGDFKLKAGKLDDKTRWLLPDAQARFAELDSERTRLPLRQQFPHGGYYILGSEFDTRNEIRLLADAGPLGYGAGAARGHADALSFTLSVGGREFLIDPGTYAYHAQPRWRRYFRGTSAHNTVRIDGLDQSVQAGNFVWLHKARAGCSLWLSSAHKDSFEGWHDGYMRLPDPVKHRRLIELDKRARRVLVEDTLEMEDEHDVELLFHCSERCAVDAVPGGYVLSRKSASVKILMPEAAKSASQVYCGSMAPIFGWVSRGFDARQPAAAIVWRARLTGRAVLRTEMLVQAAA